MTMKLMSKRTRAEIPRGARRRLLPGRVARSCIVLGIVPPRRGKNMPWLVDVRFSGDGCGYIDPEAIRAEIVPAD
jgi:hypothetical protein